MTVASTTNVSQYTANGSNDTFAYVFKITDEDHLEVYLDTELQESGYTVTDVGEESGGDVVFDTPPTEDVLVTLKRVVPLLQSVDYTPYDPFPAATHEGALDNLTYICQQLDEKLSRVLAAPVGRDPDIDYTMPDYSAGKAIMWDEVSKELTVSDDDFNDIVTDAETAASAAAASAASAATAKTNAETAETNAETAQGLAEDAQAAAEAAQSAAEAAQAAAEAAFETITVSVDDPSGGADNDIWFKYDAS